MLLSSKNLTCCAADESQCLQHSSCALVPILTTDVQGDSLPEIIFASPDSSHIYNESQCGKPCRRRLALRINFPWNSPVFFPERQPVMSVSLQSWEALNLPCSLLNSPHRARQVTPVNLVKSVQGASLWLGKAAAVRAGVKGRTLI